MINLLHLQNILSPLLGLMLAVLSASTPPGARLRVAMMEDAPGVLVSGNDLRVTSSGRKWVTDGPLDIKPVGKALSLNGKKLHRPVRVSTKARFLYVDGRQYRGDIIIHSVAGKLLVVDEVPLETYLVGLINAEVNSRWPEEAIKAQAVAARSYALLRAHQNRKKLFDLRAIRSASPGNEGESGKIPRQADTAANDNIGLRAGASQPFTTRRCKIIQVHGRSAR
jgi:stage II sporulation protein D